MKEEVKLFGALIIVFVLLVFTFVLTSCGDDSDNVYQTEYSIDVPAWQTVYVNGEVTTSISPYVWEHVDLSDKCVRVFSAGHVSYHKVTRVSRDDLGFTVYSIESSNNERFAYNKNKGILQYWCTRNDIETVVVYRELK